MVGFLVEVSEAQGELISQFNYLLFFKINYLIILFLSFQQRKLEQLVYQLQLFVWMLIA